MTEYSSADTLHPSSLAVLANTAPTPTGAPEQGPAGPCVVPLPGAAAHPVQQPARRRLPPSARLIFLGTARHAVEMAACLWLQRPRMAAELAHADDMLRFHASQAVKSAALAAKLRADLARVDAALNGGAR